MAFQGHLIKVASSATSNNWYTVPCEFMSEDSYKGTYSTMDEGSERNGNGVLDRNVLDHKVPHCSVTIRSLWNDQVAQMFGSSGGISTRYINAKEKNLYVQMWVAELNDYVTAECYVPDIEFTIAMLTPTRIKYEPFTLEFIGY